jgi:hypothetical protein
MLFISFLVLLLVSLSSMRTSSASKQISKTSKLTKYGSYEEGKFKALRSLLKSSDLMQGDPYISTTHLIGWKDYAYNNSNLLKYVPHLLTVGLVLLSITLVLKTIIKPTAFQSLEVVCVLFGTSTLVNAALYCLVQVLRYCRQVSPHAIDLAKIATNISSVSMACAGLLYLATFMYHILTRRNSYKLLLEAAELDNNTLAMTMHVMELLLFYMLGYWRFSFAL